MQDVLLDLAVHPLVIHNKEISPGTVGLRTNEQADTYVSLLSTNIKAYNKAYCRYFRTMCDTRFLRWKLSLLVKSISYRRFASLTVEDEPKFNPRRTPCNWQTQNCSIRTYGTCKYEVISRRDRSSTTCQTPAPGPNRSAPLESEPHNARSEVQYLPRYDKTALFGSGCAGFRSAIQRFYKVAEFLRPISGTRNLSLNPLQLCPQSSDRLSSDICRCGFIQCGYYRAVLSDKLTRALSALLARARNDTFADRGSDQLRPILRAKFSH